MLHPAINGRSSQGKAQITFSVNGYVLGTDTGSDAGANKNEVVMAGNNTPHFFSASQGINNYLGELFSLIWASYAGFREIWWQVRGFRYQYPNSSIHNLEAKFLSGLPLPGGIDLQEACIETDWNIHEFKFAKWLLFEACSLYEGWLEDVFSSILPAGEIRQATKQLQYPSGMTPKGKKTGYIAAIHKINLNKSPLIATEFFPTLKKGKLNRWSTINEHLIAYRYFKEIRNSFVHSNGLPTTELMKAHAEFQNVLITTPAVFKNKYQAPAPTTSIQLVLQDCILFATLVHHLIATFDAALCVYSKCETILEARIQAITTKAPSKWMNLTKDQQKRCRKVSNLLVSALVPEPVNVSNVMSWLMTKKLIS